MIGFLTSFSICNMQIRSDLVEKNVLGTFLFLCLTKLKSRFTKILFGLFGVPGARYSKVPENTGPEVAFLEAPVNFPGNFRAR